MSRRKTPVRLRAVCIIGTLAHNRDFSAQDFREYASIAHPHDRVSNPDRALRSLIKRGVIERSGRGRYYPTSKGWSIIERSCRLDRRRGRR